MMSAKISALSLIAANVRPLWIGCDIRKINDVTELKKRTLLFHMGHVNFEILSAKSSHVTSCLKALFIPRMMESIPS